jgi:hypothetical protein
VQPAMIEGKAGGFDAEVGLLSGIFLALEHPSGQVSFLIEQAS